MAQIQEGTVTVTNDSVTVIAEEGVDWTDAQTALLAGTPLYFSLVGSLELLRQITNVTPPNISASGFWEITLTAPWDEDSQSAVPYIIVRDFTPRLQLSMLTPGDIQTAQLWTRDNIILDQFGLSFPSSGIVARSITQDTVIPAGACLIVLDYFLIPAGVILQLEDGADMLIM